MSTRDLINLGISPDSGTGDSARRGGEKINLLFSDIYTQFGDAPIGQDPSLPFYGYRRPFFENEYRVGELHPAGKFMTAKFKTSGTAGFDATYGYGMTNSGTMSDTNADGIPDIYRDSEWYFLSRGEILDTDAREIDSDTNIHLVLPLASPGDTIIVRDSRNSWAGRYLNIWTTPYEFESQAQLDEWKAATGETSAPGPSAITVFSPLEGVGYVAPWKAHSSTFDSDLLSVEFEENPTYPGLAKSPMTYHDFGRYQITFTYVGYDEGWYATLVSLNTYDVNTSLQLLNQTIQDQDSDTTVINNLLSHNTLALDSDTQAAFVSINEYIQGADSDIIVRVVALETVLDGGTF